MQVPRIPGDEPKRLAALHRLGILDTGTEERFDRLTDLVSILLDVPIALVSLVDEDRQWFKSRVGLDVAETSRDASFCAHAIGDQVDTLTVEDALLDHRFADNPLVTGNPQIRFYAGHVVRDRDGQAVGTVCAIDRVPRRLDDRQQRALAHIGALVEQELDRRTELQLAIDLDASERTKAIVLDTLSEGVVLLNADGGLLEWNPAAEHILGLTGDEMDQQQPVDPRWTATYPDGTPWPLEERPALQVLRTGETVSNAIMGLHHPNGERRWIRINSEPVEAPDGARQVLTVITDVTAEVDEAERSRLARRLLDATLDTAPVGLAILDADRTILRCNPMFAEQAGRPADDLVGVDVLSLIHSDDREDASSVGDHLRNGTRSDAQLEQCVVRPDGSEIWVKTHLAVIADADRPLAIAATFDVTEQRRLMGELVRLTEQLAHQAQHDALTDLPNRQLLDQRLTQALARAQRIGTRIGLCFMDLDGFKRVNDTLGHAAGDALLVDVAHVLRTTIRAGDVAARIGGDEFVLVLDPVWNEDDAMEVVTRVRNSVLEINHDDFEMEHGIQFGASIGIALSEPGDTSTTLLLRADNALYRAKATHDSAISLVG